MTSVVLAAIVGISTDVGAGAPPPADVPMDAVFGNAPGDALLGDGGVYTDGADCVRSFYQTGKGNYYLRTVSGQIVCPGVPDGWGGRYVVLDFSSPVGSPNCATITGLYGDTLDPCGLNVIKDVRLFADKMFSSSSTPLALQFDPEPNPGLHAVQFSLAFVSSVPVSNRGGGTRAVNDGGVVARLSRLTQQGNRTRWVVIGDYHMPFELTVLPIDPD